MKDKTKLEKMVQDLLAALKGLAPMWEYEAIYQQWPKEIEAAKKAIAKAEGA